MLLYFGKIKLWCHQNVLNTFWALTHVWEVELEASSAAEPLVDPASYQVII